MEIDRRQFLLLSGAVLLGAEGILNAATATEPASPDVPWHQRIKRIGQLNMNERDPLEMDINAWADYWADLKVDAVLISVTGIVAFYPTKIPLFRPGAFLGGRDFFGDCCTAAKKRGMRVIARYSPDLQWGEAAATHPEWFRRARNGNMVVNDQVPDLYATCHFSTYYTQQIPAIMREVNARYDIDGIFTNAWPDIGSPAVCYCGVCQGTAAPRTPAFYQRQLQRYLELWKQFDAIAKEKKPDNVYIGNLGEGTQATVNVKTLCEKIDWFNADNQGRGGEETPAWGVAIQGRVARSVMKGRPITNVTGAYAHGNVNWRNTAKTPAEANLWMAQTMASGMTVWYHWVGGQSGMGEDHRWEKVGRDFMQWMARHDPHFTYKRSLANVGVVWSQRCNVFYTAAGGGAGGGGAAAGGYGNFMQGLYYALLEGRTFFDFVHEDDLGPETLGKFATLLLPNVALLSDQQCQQLKAYADAGGSLLTTFETSAYDETGQRRGEFGLADVMGITRASDVQGPHGNSSLARIERDHEILAGFADTKILPGSEYRLPVRAAGSDQPVLTVVAPYTFYPPEMAYTNTPRTSEPAAVLSEQGQSRRAHFSGDVDRTFWRSGNTDIGQLLQNSIRWLTRGVSPITVQGDGLVEMFAWETDPGYAVHLVNYTNPNLHKGWVRKHYPLGPQTVRMNLPIGQRISRVELLRAEKEIAFQQTNGTVEFTIPQVTDYEVAAMTRE